MLTQFVEQVPSVSHLSACSFIRIKEQLEHLGKIRYYSSCNEGGVLREVSNTDSIEQKKKLLKMHDAVTFQSINKHLIDNEPHLLIASESRSRRQMLMFKLHEKQQTFELGKQVMDSKTLLRVHMDVPYVLLGMGRKSDLFRSIIVSEIILKQRPRHISQLPDEFGSLASIWHRCMDCHDTDLTSEPGKQFYNWMTLAQHILRENDSVLKHLETSFEHISELTNKIYIGDSLAIQEGLEACHRLEDTVYKHGEIVLNGMNQAIRDSQQHKAWD